MTHIEKVRLQAALQALSGACPLVALLLHVSLHVSLLTAHNLSSAEEAQVAATE